MDVARTRAGGRVLLVSCYELGHQPFLAATAAGFLAAAGHEVRACDLAVETLADADVDWADTVAIAVPMHTASRLATAVVAGVRRRRGTGIRVVLYGLYASQAAAALEPGAVDAAIAGEAEAELVRCVEGETAIRGLVLDRLAFPLPVRDALPPPQRYARLLWRGQERVAGYVEASRGCVHRCRHCPVPVVYDGRIRVLPVAVVVADVERQWEAGVRHLTIGDPDALNAPRHTLAVLRAIHERLPDLTVDLTVKVEHILEHAHLLPTLRSLGVVMLTSAVECVDDIVLAVLAKGHTAADALAAVRLARGADLELRPSLLPFTPWSSLASHVRLLDALAAWDLLDSVDPVHLSIRLLLPEGSLLLDAPELTPHLTGALDASGHAWRHPDPRMDDLAERTGVLVADAVDACEEPRTTHARIRTLAAQVAAEAGMRWAARPPEVLEGLAGPAAAERPRLSEAWFCCAEPTPAQVAGGGGAVVGVASATV